VGRCPTPRFLRHRVTTKNIFKKVVAINHACANLDSSSKQELSLLKTSKQTVQTKPTTIVRRLVKNPQSDEEIKFDPVDTTPIQRKSDHKIVQATFVVGTGLGGQGVTMTEVDNSTTNFRLQGEWRLSRTVGMDVFVELGSKSISYTNGTLAMQKNVIGIGLPLYLSSADRSSWTTFLEPTVQAVRTGFSFSDTRGNTASSASKWQFGPGINLGTQVRFCSWEQSGLSIRPQVGIYFPMSNSGVSSTPAFQGGLILQWEFFKK